MRVRNFGSRTPELLQWLYFRVPLAEATARATNCRDGIEPVGIRELSVPPPAMADRIVQEPRAAIPLSRALASAICNCHLSGDRMPSDPFATLRIDR